MSPGRLIVSKFLRNTVVFLLVSITCLSQKVTRGIKKARAARVTYQGNTYDTYSVNIPDDHLVMLWKGVSGKPLTSIGNLKNELALYGKHLFFATNAGMFTLENAPKGLYIQYGNCLVPLDTGKSGIGNFYMQPNGVFLVTKKEAAIVPTAKVTNYAHIIFATQSGPMLVTNGEFNSHFTKGSLNLNIRSGVGIADNGRVVFAISNGKVDFYDFAAFFRDTLHCNNALYLDGAISKMYLPELNRLDTGGDFGAMIGVVE